MSSPYLVPVAQILRDVPSSYEVDFEAPFDEPHEFAPRGPAETDVFPEATVRVQLRLESFSGGLRGQGPRRGALARGLSALLGAGARACRSVDGERALRRRAPCPATKRPI